MQCSARNIAESLDGRKEGLQWRCRCPIHHGRSLLVCDKDGEILINCVTCFEAGDAWRVLDHLRKEGLLPQRSDDDKRTRPPRPELTAWREMPPSTQAVAIFRRGRRIAGTVAERYLADRDLDISLLDHDAVRFLPAHSQWPASLVALLTSFVDASSVVGLQFTPLADDGTRAGDRRFLKGTVAMGGIIRLTPDAELTTHLGLAEGLETALSVMTGLYREGHLVLPVWSTCGKPNMASLPVLPGVERLTVFADNASPEKPLGDGRPQARKLAERWADAGREAFISAPAVGDWNDAQE
jgi:hypothetical protein